MSLREDVLAILIWLSLWGLSDNIIAKYATPKEHDTRIMIYASMFIIVAIISYFLIDL